MSEFKLYFMSPDVMEPVWIARICFLLSVGVKRSASVRLAETPACRWRGFAPSAVLTAASAPAPLPPTPFSPALQSHLARDPTGIEVSPKKSSDALV